MYIATDAFSTHAFSFCDTQELEARKAYLFPLAPHRTAMQRGARCGACRVVVAPYLMILGWGAVKVPYRGLLISAFVHSVFTKSATLTNPLSDSAVVPANNSETNAILPRTTHQRHTCCTHPVPRHFPHHHHQLQLLALVLVLHHHQ